ncbi:metallophosphoesterase family protein [Trinickia violacea]|uniref:Phosphoesterase n=1 Tax=Trinickia violacea TaxID=2571746 RepID=A0A4P8IMK5_9BURK|nr:metallophosphoesterase family protein [Trinickia violacea]QCP49191.1 metallophosphoesterase family protein [Trinickia violacea]
MSVSRIGLISDTHNLVRPEALQWLAGCDAIIHAGDICAPHVLDALAQIAPVTAVRGNNDFGEWAAHLPVSTTLEVQRVKIHVVHDIADLQFDALADGVCVVVTGHSHKPQVEERDGVLFVNPGSAGPRRFKLPISAGMLTIEDDRAEAALHTLVA